MSEFPQRALIRPGSAIANFSAEPAYMPRAGIAALQFTDPEPSVREKS